MGLDFDERALGLLSSFPGFLLRDSLFHEPQLNAPLPGLGGVVRFF